MNWSYAADPQLRNLPALVRHRMTSPDKIFIRSGDGRAFTFSDIWTLAGQMAGALRELYRTKLPLRSLYREDRFGWSDRLRGANDYRSMAAGNSSAFNCRGVVGRPSTRSPHSYGRSFDVNTWENLPVYRVQGWQ